MFRSIICFIFFLCFFSYLLLPQYFPNFHPLYFAPYLGLAFYQLPKQRVLTHALLIGFFCDLSSSYLFGIHTTLYVTTSALTYRTQRILLKDNIFSLPIINVIFSLLFVLLSYPVLTFFNPQLQWSLSLFALNVKYITISTLAYSTAIYLLPCIITRGMSKLIAFLRILICY
ncbi:hypothetical protein [Candidatus Chlamydia sanziniae]|uniref:Rod shape-determining protein MreD n=1 Tax=Candidatus Chlamydia sanziniae TaxID=1806891 RepID=A0A1A9HVQ5_9CHLA|nr:hypothetical protein [Candidatus Chlamydia sanziniae]ANH79079.1 hypothetical protein Cs308_0909 [Candidatus Chlamydia sanziniae]